MPETRHDPVSGRQVIIAPERLQRPNAVSLSAWNYNDEATCPFCAGHENQTPDEVAAYRTATSRQPWDVRIVPNKYPAMTMHETDTKRPPSGAQGLFKIESMQAQQEVIIESPHHLESFTELSAESARLVVRTYRDRLQAATQDSRFQAGLIFKNYGPAAGASLGHIHSQFVAFSQIPSELRLEVALANEYYQRHKSCLFCTIVTTETHCQERVVAMDDFFVAFCPFASRLPYEMCVVPRVHESRFDHCSNELCNQLATFLSGLLRRLEATIPHVAYNFWVHSSPFDSGLADQYHWHLEILPRVAKTAGFEWGSGQLINPVPPEQAANQLRAFRVD